MHSISTYTDTSTTMPRLTNDNVKHDVNGLFRTADENCPTVLIVDDNDIVSDYLQSALQAYGYHAIVAATPQEAMDQCRRHPRAIQTSIVDVKLGCFNGFETAQKLIGICPEMKVVLMSGYPYDHLVRAGRLPQDMGVTLFLQKPFLPSEIMAAMNALKRPS